MRRLASTTESGVHLYGVSQRRGILAFGLWYSLEGGGLELLPPESREDGRLGEFERGDVAYGDWIIVDAASRVRGLGRALFAIALNDMAEAGYRGWYGRTVVPDNRALYERLYLRHGRAELVGEWEDGPLTRIGFLGELERGWTQTLLEAALRGCPRLEGL
jgi:GNAT superfamily N-acetyltransferase